MRELERQLGRMSAAQKGEVVEALRAVLGGAQRLSGRMGLSGGATLKLLGWLSVAMNQNKSMRQIVETAKGKARAVGPHVEALFAAF